MDSPLSKPTKRTALNGHHTPDRIVHSVELTSERKSFIISLRENGRGQFIRIVEQATDRQFAKRNAIILPATGLDDFIAKLQELRANQ